MRWAQVRWNTNTGKKRDRVAHREPAAAPLGTDDEAGGAVTSAEAVAELEEERQRRRRARRSPKETPSGREDG